jgi:predicted DNA-binding protein
MFNNIKLYFTNKPYYEQRKRYIKLQKKYRNKLKKLAKEFCPWSGYYMHEMIKTMLEFYHKTYLAKDCCWSADEHLEEISTSLAVALHYARELEAVEDMEYSECLIAAQKYKDFAEYVAAWEKKVNTTIDDSNNKEVLLGSLANEFLTEKYTKAMYSIIGEHIWEWCD